MKFAGLAIVLAAAATGNAAIVTLTASDTLGQSSFASGLHWSDAAAPSSGNSYKVGISLLRTPADGNSYTFGGNSLSIDGPSGDFGYKGTGNTGVIIIDSLILNGGLIRHINGAADVFTLAGNINVIADSQIYAKQGLINITANIEGSGKITNPGSDGAGRTLRFSASTNTYTGSLVNNGRFNLADNAIMNFVIGASGVNNSVSGTGAENVFDGDFNFNLTGASSTLGDSWTIVSTANKTFSPTFTVVGFTETADVWSNGVYQFSEATGILSVVPEPASLSVIVLGSAMIRRRRA